MAEDERMKELLEGVAQFNNREFFDCHETLEHLWMHDRSHERELIQGIIQIAVGYYHYLRNNRVGALKLLTRGLERIKNYEPGTMDLNIHQLSIEVAANIEEINKSEKDSFPAINIPIIEVLRD
jgi:uncharacterized protein